MWWSRPYLSRDAPSVYSLCSFGLFPCTQDMAPSRSRKGAPMASQRGVASWGTGMLHNPRLSSMLSGKSLLYAEKLEQNKDEKANIFFGRWELFLTRTHCPQQVPVEILLNPVGITSNVNATSMYQYRSQCPQHAPVYQDPLQSEKWLGNDRDNLPTGQTCILPGV